MLPSLETGNPGPFAERTDPDEAAIQGSKLVELARRLDAVAGRLRAVNIIRASADVHDVAVELLALERHLTNPDTTVP